MKLQFDFANDRKGSFADPHDTPKAAVRAAGIEGIADLAIRRKRPFVSGKFRESTRELERGVLAVSYRPGWRRRQELRKRLRPGELTTNQVFFETLHGVALKGF
jgi:hypothetical protein